MPRKPRFFLPGVTCQVVQRGHSREPVFFDVADYSAYLGWLAEAAGRYGCAIHAYILMDNHVHLIVVPERSGSLTRAVGETHKLYMRMVNFREG